MQFDCEASLTKEELTEQNDCCSKVETAQFWNIKEPHITLWWPGVRSVTCVGAWSALQHVARLGDHSEAQLTGLPVRLTWGQSSDKTRAHGKYKSDNWPILALHLTTTTPETAWLSRTRRVIRLQVIINQVKFTNLLRSCGIQKCTYYIKKGMTCVKTRAARRSPWISVWAPGSHPSRGYHSHKTLELQLGETWCVLVSCYSDSWWVVSTCLTSTPPPPRSPLPPPPWTPTCGGPGPPAGLNRGVSVPESRHGKKD